MHLLLCGSIETSGAHHPLGMFAVTLSGEKGLESKEQQWTRMTSQALTKKSQVQEEQDSEEKDQEGDFSPRHLPHSFTKGGF